MNNKIAVIIAHPGHELRILQWIKNVSPEIYILTDGSGSKGVSRIDDSLSIVRKVKAKKANIFGLMSDQQFYRIILNKDTDLFVSIAERLHSSMTSNNIELIAGDACEGYNTMHDICRNIINSIVVKSKRQLDKDILNYEFSLENFDNCAKDIEGAIIVRLTELEIKQKILALEDFHSLQDEINRIRASAGDVALATECLRPVKIGMVYDVIVQPYYEKYAKSQIKKGIYKNVISYKEHIYPIFRALEKWSLE